MEPSRRRVVGQQHHGAKAGVDGAHGQPCDAVAPTDGGVAQGVVAVDGIAHAGIGMALVGTGTQGVVDEIRGVEHKVDGPLRRTQLSGNDEEVYTLGAFGQRQLVDNNGVAHAVFARYGLPHHVHKLDAEGGVHPVAHVVVDPRGVGHRGVAGGSGRGIDHEGGVVDAVHRVARQLVGRHQSALLAHQVAVEREFPLEDVAVVVGPSVHNFDVPVAVDGASHEAGQVLFGVVEVGSVGHVARIYGVTFRGRRRVGAAVDDAVAGGVLVAVAGVAAPAVVPAHAGLVAIGVGVARTHAVLLVDGDAEVGTQVGVATRCPASVLRGNGAVARRCARAAEVHQRGFLPIGAGDVDVYVADVRVLQFDTYVVDVVGVANHGAGTEILERHRRAVGAPHLAAFHAVGQEGRVGVVEGGLVVHHHHLVVPHIAHAHLHRIGQAGGAVHSHTQDALSVYNGRQHAGNQRDNVYRFVILTRHNRLQKYKKYCFEIKKLY